MWRSPAWERRREGVRTVEYRQSTLADLDTFLENRMECMTAVRAAADRATLEAHTRAYWEARLPSCLSGRVTQKCCFGC